jgi:RimJ/RimL family protein N-acetyltransferase
MAFALATDAPRSSLQIETRGGRYIGWVGSYHVDEGYVPADGTGACAVGISISEPASRGHGYSYQALGAFIGYLVEQGEAEILTQTWSGNLRMIHVAERMGFVECCRKPGLRLVRGERFDGLTFRLDRRRLEAFRG